MLLTVQVANPSWERGDGTR